MTFNSLRFPTECVGFFLGINKIFIKIENTCDSVVETKDIMLLGDVKTYEVVKRVNAEREYAQGLVCSPFKCSWTKEVKNSVS